MELDQATMDFLYQQFADYYRALGTESKLQKTDTQLRKDFAKKYKVEETSPAALMFAAYFAGMCQGLIKGVASKERSDQINDLLRK